MKLLTEIIYPLESSFYPNALILLAVFVASIFSAIYFLLWIRKTTNNKFPLNIENHISLATLIISVLVVFVPFFVQTPLLDYDVSIPHANTTQAQNYVVNVRNYGMVTANNVVISMVANDGLVRFLNFTSVPFTSSSVLSAQSGIGAFKIDVMPPRAENTVTSKVDVNNADAKLTTYVRSDEAVGYHDTILTIILYVIVFLVVLPLAIGKWKPWMPSTTNKNRHKPSDINSNEHNV